MAAHIMFVFTYYSKLHHVWNHGTSEWDFWEINILGETNRIAKNWFQGRWGNMIDKIIVQSVKLNVLRSGGAVQNLSFQYIRYEIP